MTAARGSNEDTGEMDWATGDPAVLVNSCIRCHRRWYLPRRWCPACGSDDVIRTRSSGVGQTAAVTVIHRRTGGGQPIGIALVDLDEGVRMMARCHLTTLVGIRVRLTFVPAEDPNQNNSLIPYCEDLV